MPKARTSDDVKYRDKPKVIAKYLTDALATGDAVLVTKAIGNVVRAQGMTSFSRKLGMRRESLYRSFRGDMSPAFETVIAVLTTLGVQLAAKPRSK
jgi:probable addiction module antidote protein